MMRSNLPFLIMVALLASLAGGVLPARAGSVVVPILQDPVYRKQVQTFKERRLKRVVPQTQDFSCGAAALATLMHYYYGDPVSEREAIKGMVKAGDREKIRTTGFSMLDMQKFAHTRQYKAEGYRIADVRQLSKLTVPVIALIETSGGYSHFVVVRKVTDKYVYISDPSWGNRRLTLGAFQHEWNKIILAITGPSATGVQGLYAGDYPLGSSKEEVIRTEGLLGPRIAMDPTFFFIHTSNPSY